MPKTRYFVLLLFGPEEQETRPITAANEAEAKAAAAGIAQQLEREGRVVLFQEKRPNPLFAWTRRPDGSLSEASVEALK